MDENKIFISDMTIKMQLEKLESLETEVSKVYQTLKGSRVSQEHQLVMAYQYHLQQLDYIKRYRGINENLHK